MKKKVMDVVKVTLGNLVLVGLLCGCGNMADLDVPEKESSAVVENIIINESEAFETEHVEETNSNETEVMIEEENNTTAEAMVETEDETAAEVVETENEEETENEATTESIEYIIITDDTPGVNGATVAAVAKEYEQKYIKYEDMAPTTMYAIRYSEMYPDLNASEGVLRMDGCVFVGDEVIIDGKGTYDGVEYYRIKRPENCFNPYSSILPADALSLEKPIPQAAVEQAAPTTVMTASAPAQEKVNIEELVGADVYASLSEEEKRDLDKIFNYDGQIPWAKDPNADIPGFSCERNENGGFTIYDPNLTPEQLERIGRLIFY